jgi:hypothetical protein
MINAQKSYERLIALGMPAEEARGVIPHDMPTRIHMVCDLRQLLAEAGKRTCTQAQFPWRMIFAGIANALRERGSIREGRGYQRKKSVDGISEVRVSDGWQFREIANRIRPVCYQTGGCGFMAQFDRSCSIRSRVDGFAALGVPSSRWSKDHEGERDSVSPLHYIDGVGRDEAGKPVWVSGINDAEWALNPGAARS